MTQAGLNATKINITPDEAVRESAPQYFALEQKIKSVYHNPDIQRIRDAYEYAARAHAGQRRKDGSAYVTHCIAAADISVDMGLDEDSIVAALLHDVIEDTPASHDMVAKRFGETVANLVEGVTKLTRVQLVSKEEAQMESLRKMLMAMSKDIRVILIKIADRLHNMRTMQYQREDKQRSKSLETMEIYAPIAHRLGMQKVKWELEDLSLQYLDPVGYKEINDSIGARMEELQAFMDAMQARIQARLEAEGIKAQVYGRIKHTYSIYRKMYAQHTNLAGIFDLCAFRAIVDTVGDCYHVLGIIHEIFKPLPGRFKDYIATPKPNMYQSLHTTVIGSEGIPFELQIRTHEMHQIAEYGIAAHWKYKSGDKGVKVGDEEKFAWVRSLLETQQESDDQDFFHNLKVDMFDDEVYVFSPKGDVISLPAGATPIDFAYAIHSGVGNAMVGASVNGRIVTFDYKLKNGDVVEVRTSKSAPGPSRDWLTLAKSSSARTKIKQWFKKEKREENIMRGSAMFDAELKRAGLTLSAVLDEKALPQILKRLSFETIDDMYASIGYGGITAIRTVNRVKDTLQQLKTMQAVSEKTSAAKEQELVERINEYTEKRAAQPQKAINGILVEGLDNCLIKFSKCCTPVPGDEVIGFITRGAGISVHRKDCPNYLKQLESGNPADAGRWIKVQWADTLTERYTTTLSLLVRDRIGLLMDVAAALSTLNVNVVSIQSVTKGDTATITLSMEVKNAAEIKLVMNKLNSIKDVLEVSRASGKAK
ncbi:MAG: bifunctional (p)ppGpp synthetase/guanosine-3',5'-bis(diphosphate) 3'-pyrophosphohydrolase [Oscillospiraceae bacterium]|nr:bifunctional (p)ppGpp synthetase/guanosine-3',5'-bis(diphosphate) 3'-pyrophosphohydrolase [Oscillospiraceae bacterium]